LRREGKARFSRVKPRDATALILQNPALIADGNLNPDGCG
jgi:hypothetical protein